eukprot:3937452-Rhodomonas_salina.1
MARWQYRASVTVSTELRQYRTWHRQIAEPTWHMTTTRPLAALAPHCAIVIRHVSTGHRIVPHAQAERATAIRFASTGHRTTQP